MNCFIHVKIKKMTDFKVMTQYATSLFGDEISPSLFTWDKYCGRVGYSLSIIFDTINYCGISDDFICEGWCVANKIEVRPKSDGVVIMLWHKENEEYTWCHASSDLIGTMFKNKELKK